MDDAHVSDRVRKLRDEAVIACPTSQRTRSVMCKQSKLLSRKVRRKPRDEDFELEASEFGEVIELITFMCSSHSATPMLPEESVSSSALFNDALPLLEVWQTVIPGIKLLCHANNESCIAIIRKGYSAKLRKVILRRRLFQSGNGLMH